MRPRLSKGDIAFIVIVVIAVVALVVGLAPWFFNARSASQPPEQATANPSSQATVINTSKVIIGENAHLGTSSWSIPDGKEAITQIQAYASATSVSPGQKLTFYVSTQKEGTGYSIDIYRLGWYAGAGGRLMATQAAQIGHAQGYYDPTTYRLIGCTACHLDLQTGLVEANWQPSYTLTVPSDWTTGVYLAKFTDVNGMQTYAPFDVRGSTFSVYVAVTSDTTYQAYNMWGGYSLYQGPGSSITTGEVGKLSKAVKVSFDRPYAQVDGSGYVLLYEAAAIHWLERQGYDLSYISSVDLHEDPGQLLQHRVYLSLGHDEYWTKEMRDGVEYARDHGVGLAFLGANAAYWQIRFEPDSAGTRDRTIVCYKVQTVGHDLARDPLFGKDNARVTAQWRDTLLARPENALIGIMYSGYELQRGFPWHVNSEAASPLLDGTGLQPGEQYGCGLVGNEWDRVFANGATPAGLQVLGVSPTVNVSNQADFSNTTYYIAPSGAMVFATGSFYWTLSLDSYRLYTDLLCTGQDSVVPGMQKLMAHVMDALVKNYRSQQLTVTSTA